MSDRLTCNPDELHARLEGLAAYMASVLREEACERGIEIGTFLEWTQTGSGIDAVSMSLEMMLDKYVVSAGEPKP